MSRPTRKQKVFRAERGRCIYCGEPGTRCVRVLRVMPLTGYPTREVVKCTKPKCRRRWIELWTLRFEFLTPAKARRRK